MSVPFTLRCSRISIGREDFGVVRADQSLLYEGGNSLDSFVDLVGRINRYDDDGLFVRYTEETFAMNLPGGAKTRDPAERRSTIQTALVQEANDGRVELFALPG